MAKGTDFQEGWGPCEKAAKGVAVQQWSMATEQGSAYEGSEVGYIHVTDYISTHMEDNKSQVS